MNVTGQKQNSTRVLALPIGAGLLLFLIGCALAQRPRSVSQPQQNIRPSNVVKVGARGSFQAALNAAQAGDTIVLEAGATYLGTFVLPVKSGAEYITIQSSRLSELPGDGQRVSPAQAALMPKLVSPGAGGAALSTAAGAHHYKLIGIEIAPATDTTFSYDLVTLGESGYTQLTLESVPHHLIVDRCYIHPYPEQGLKRGIALNSAHTEILNSYIAGFKVVGQDSQAIAGWNGPGPYRIINNYLEAAGENVMFGGSPSAIPNLIPSDIEIRRNYFFKPLRWRIGDPSYGGTAWSVKNLFELKTGRRVVIDGNVFENNWAHAQVGFAILFNSIDDTGSWARIEDITFSNNIVRHSGQGFNIRGSDATGARASRITIRNNLFDDISSAKWGGDGRLFQVYEGATDVVIDHNTGINSHLVVSATGAPSSGFVYTNNLTRHNGLGVFGDGGYIGAASLNQYYPGWTFAKNVLAELPSDVSGSQYPPANFFPTSFNALFVDAAAGNYRLASTSPYKAQATDGKDIGCDFNELEAAHGGITPTPAPIPTPTPIPTTQLGEAILRAKRDGQNLANQVSYSGGARNFGSSNAQTNSAEQAALDLFIGEIQQARTTFNANPGIYPAATRIGIELGAALQRALQANDSLAQNDIPGFRNHLREAISHLELSGVLIAYPNVTNPIDIASYAVRQHYVDFFDREPDQAGNDFWVNQFSACGTDAQCFEDKRIHVSAAFFISIEFQQTGYFVHRLYRSSYARVPSIAEFMPDNALIGRGVIVDTPGWEARLAASKQAFLEGWVQRADFTTRYSALTNDQYVDALIANLGVTIDPAERQKLVVDLANGSSRANVLGKLAENEVFSQHEFNSAFVLMQYFGYLRRDPDGAGFNFWKNKLEQFGGNYQSAEMVKAFLASQEYRSRFNL